MKNKRVILDLSGMNPGMREEMCERLKHEVEGYQLTIKADLDNVYAYIKEDPSCHIEYEEDIKNMMGWIGACKGIMKQLKKIVEMKD